MTPLQCASDLVTPVRQGRAELKWKEGSKKQASGFQKQRQFKCILETALNLTAGIYKLSVVKTTLSTSGSTTPSKAYYKKNSNLWVYGDLSLQNLILFQISALDTLSFTVFKLNTFLS